MLKFTHSRIFKLILMWLMSSPLLAQIPAINRGDVPSLEISNALEIYLDHSSELTISQVSDPSFKGFKRNSELFPSFGAFGGTAWLHFVVENIQDQDVQHVLLLNANVLDAKLYFTDEQQHAVEQKAGRINIGDTEDYPNIMPRFVITLKPMQTKHYYMSIRNYIVYSVKLSINSYEGFYQNQRVTHYFAGFYVGIMLIMILYNLFIYASTRDPAYLWYVLTVFAIHLGVIGQFVTNGDYFGIKSPILPSSDMWVAKCIGFASLIQFSRVFLQTVTAPRYDLFLKINLASCPVFLILGFFFPLTVLNAVNNIFLLMTIVTFIFYSGHLFSRGYGYARYYFIAWFPLMLIALVMVILNMSKNAHLMPNMVYFVCVSACAEVLLLSMALADKFNEMRRAKARADREHKEAVLAMNRSLEATVKEKTRDIRSMLDNLKLGIFMVNHDLVVSEEHSRHLRTMVSSPSIDSKLFSNILFEDAHLGSDVRNQVEAAIVASTEINEIGYDGNSHLLIRHLHKKTNQDSRDIEVDWSPIQNEDGIVEKILVCMKDVTEFNQLKKEGQEQKRRMELLSQYLSADRVQTQKLGEHLLSLVEDARRINHRDVMNWIEKDRLDYIGQLFADLHTDKAWSRKLKLTHLSDAIHEGENYLHELKRSQSSLSIEKIHSLLDHIATILEEYRKAASSLGLTPIGDPSKNRIRNFESLIADVLSERISLAAQLGKPVPLIQLNVNESIAMNAELEQTLETLLIHFLRNSMDHGIETSDERRMREKSEQGLISVSARKVNLNYVLEYRDDGRGLDLDRIQAKALENGLVTSQSVLTKEEVAELIFSSGFSTQDNVSDISGRGVGLDAVRRQVKAMHGSINVRLVENLAPGSFGRWSVVFCLTWPCDSQAVLKTGT